MRTVYLLTIIVFLSVKNSFGQLPYLEKHWWEPNGIVNAIEIDTVRQQVYLGGDFTSVSYPVKYNAFLNHQIGIPDIRYPDFGSNQIFTSVADGNGGYFLGGSFTQIGDSVRNNIAHLDANGAVTSKFSGLGFNGDVKKLYLENDSLITLGSFNSFGPVRSKVAMLDPVSELVVSAFPEVDNEIYSVAGDGQGGFFIAGYFTKVGDSARYRIAHLDSSMKVTAWNTEISGAPFCLAVKGDTLIVGGNISQAGGQPRLNLVAIDINTGGVLPWNPGVSGGGVSEMAVYGDKLYFIGNFTLVNGSGPPYFSSVDLNTGNTIAVPNTSINPYNQGNCALKIIGDTAYIGGSFYWFHNSPRNNIAAFDLITHSVTNWLPQGVDSTVNAIGYSNGRLVITGMSPLITIANLTSGQIAGNFYYRDKYSVAIIGDTAYIGTYTFDHQPPILGINLLNSNFINLNFPCTGSAYKLNAVNGKLLASSSNFRAVASSLKKQVCQLNTVTCTALPWTIPSLNETASDLIVDGNELFVSGKFWMVGDSLRPFVASINRFTGQVNTWKCDAFTGYSYEVAKIYKKNNIIFLGGRFNYLINGITRKGLMAINRQTGGLYNWSPYSNVDILDISGNDSLLFVCGTFDSLNSQPSYSIGVLNLFDGTLAPYSININRKTGNLVRSLSYLDSKLYLGGSFDTLNGEAIKNLASFDLLTNSVSSWRPEPDQQINYVKAYSSKIIVSGSFSAIGTFSRTNFVALGMISGIPTPLNIQLNGKIKTLALCRDDLFLGGEFDTVNTIPRVSLASVNLNSGNLNSFNAGLISKYDVLTLFTDSTDLYVGGWFSQFMGQSRNRIASINIDNLSLNSLSLPLINSVHKILKKGDSLFVMGNYWWANSPLGNLQGLISVNPNTGNPHVINLNPVLYSDVRTGVLVGDSIYVGGNFNTIGNVSRHNMAVFNLIDGEVGSWNPDTNGASNSGIYVSAMVAYDTLIFVGGAFPAFPYPSSGIYNHFAAVDKYSGQLSAWRPALGGYVNEMKVHESKLFIGGNMNHSSGLSLPRKKFFVFSLKSGPQISAIADVTTCYSDTIGPIPIIIADSINVNTVTIQASSSDTSIISISNILLTGAGANRFISLVPSQGAIGYCTIFIKATNQAGGSSYSNFTVYIHPATVTISGIQSFCFGDSTQLSASSGYSSYQWNTGSVASSIVVLQPGNYIVTVMNSSGCVAIDSVEVIENLLPQLNIISATSTDICQGDSVQLIADPGYLNYQWLLNNTQIAGATSISYYAGTTGNYKCEVSDANGCENQSNNIKAKIVCIPIGPNQEKLEQLNDNQVLIAIILPNPSMNDFQLKIDCNDHSSTVISVFDSQHRIVQSGDFDFNGDFYTIKKMSPGVYFVEIRCGKKFIVKKIVQMD